MIRKLLLLIFLLVGIVATCFSQATKEKDEEIRKTPKHFIDTLQVMKIYVISQKEVRKQTAESVKRTRKFYKRTNYPWTKPKLSKAVESYVITLKDTANYWYTVVSQKVETTSNEKIMIGKKYEMELNMIRYMGEIAGPWFPTIFLNGNYIPLPKYAQPFSIFTSSNLNGLYYVK